MTKYWRRNWHHYAMTVLAILTVLLVSFPTRGMGSDLTKAHIPPMTGRVNDHATLLSTIQERVLATKLAQIEIAHKQIGTQIVVLTARSLLNHTIEDYSIHVARAWKIGQKDTNTGVLIIVAPNERKIRIEVGYGLEGVITDAQAKLIIQRDMVPKLKKGEEDWYGALDAAVTSVHHLLVADKPKAILRMNMMVHRAAFDPLMLFLLIAGVAAPFGVFVAVRQRRSLREAAWAEENARVARGNVEERFRRANRPNPGSGTEGGPKMTMVPPGMTSSQKQQNVDAARRRADEREAQRKREEEKRRDTSDTVTDVALGAALAAVLSSDSPSRSSSDDDSGSSWSSGDSGGSSGGGGDFGGGGASGEF